MNIVISQPMYFPWRGIFEQLILSDIYIHYDDVQFSQGRSFTSRVQIKTPNGIQWLSVPVIRNKNQLIKDTVIDNTQKWKNKHLNSLKQNYAKAKYKDDMLGLVNDVFSLSTDLISELNKYAIEKIVDYLGINSTIYTSSHYPNSFNSSEKLLHLVNLFEGETYITGQGAKNYLDHNLFEESQVKVKYMVYDNQPYHQLHGDYTPYVSILDLIANEGKESINYLTSKPISWQKFISNEPNTKI